MKPMVSQNQSVLQSNDRVTAAEIGVDGVNDETYFQVAFVAHLERGTAGYIQIFRQDKFDTLDLNVAAAWEMMRRNGKCFHTALMLDTMLIYLC